MPPQYEYAPLRLPSDTGREEARAVMTVHAQFGGWELFQTRLYSDGRRRVILRRKLTGQQQPPLMT